MKLLSAEFKNFRLLRDLKLEFSNDSNQNLTVIRAANESGKTTILHGLQWALYGMEGLPGKGAEFRLHPIDWRTDEQDLVQITATVKFEVTSHRRHRGGELRETIKRYRLVRTALEGVDKTGSQPTSTVNLFELTDIGDNPIPSPDLLINNELPPELREVFFTDGDRALSFIETDVDLSKKRERVRNAIRSLLGLGVIESAMNHVKNAEREVNKKAIKTKNIGNLNEIAASLEKMETLREEYLIDLEDAKQQFVAFDESVKEINRKILAELKKGDRETLKRDLEEINKKIEILNSQINSAQKQHSALFRSPALAKDLLQPILEPAFTMLDKLRDQGKLPSTTIPVLQECLEAEICICGEKLEIDDMGSKERREYIKKKIVDSTSADELQHIIADMYYSSKSFQDTDDTSINSWCSDFNAVANQRDGLEELHIKEGRKLRVLEKKLDSIPDNNIKELRLMLTSNNNQRDSFLAKKSRIETQLTELDEKRKEHELRRSKLLREQEKGTRILAELVITQDILKVLNNAYDRIISKELQKVSELMNEIFLEMIGADPEQGAIIQRAEISEEYDIIVFGPNNRHLNPDRDLNGASRRALTLSFILALTKVSEVEAPNVIDTPLGMTSGFVKRSILRTAVRESTQLILFLTHDEISGCEQILDQVAGTIITLTNPAHYPKMLVNNPGIEDRKVIRCDCDHRSECRLCLRHDDIQEDHLVN